MRLAVCRPACLCNFLCISRPIVLVSAYVSAREPVHVDRHAELNVSLRSGFFFKAGRVLSEL